MLTRSDRGHLVTIQPNHRAARPFLDTKSEISELIAHLGGGDETDRLSPSAVGVIRRRSLQLSTIIYERTTMGFRDGDNVTKSDKLFNVLAVRSVSDVATRIIDGIRHERRMWTITERRSLIDYMCDAIKLKFT